MSVNMEELKLQCIQMERTFIERVVAMSCPMLRRFVLPLYDNERTLEFYKKMNHIVQQELNRPCQGMTTTKPSGQFGDPTSDLPELSQLGKPLTKLLTNNIRVLKKLKTTRETICEEFDQRFDADKTTKIGDALKKYDKLLATETKNRVLIECTVELKEKEFTKRQRALFEAMTQLLCEFTESLSNAGSQKPDQTGGLGDANNNRHEQIHLVKTKKKTARLFRKCKVEPLSATETLRSQAVDYDIFLAPCLRKDTCIRA